MDIKRVTLFAGHYGSGKTNIAVNFALYLRKLGKRTAIADLDIVNPYFRTKDSARELAEAGVELISPQFANSNVDLPALPAGRSTLELANWGEMRSTPASASSLALSLVRK